MNANLKNGFFFVHFRGDFDANKCFEKIEFNFYFINMYLD